MGLREKAESLAFQGRDAFVRFPVAFLTSAVFCLMLLAEKDYTPLLATLFCLFFWSVSAALFMESHNRPRWQASFIALAGGVAFYAIFHFTPDMDLPLLLLGSASVLSMTLAAYMRKQATIEAMESFCMALARNIGFTFWVAFVLFLGGAAIMGSLHYLFGFRIAGEAYLKLWFFCATFFAPVFAMGNLPREFDLMREAYSKPERIILVHMLLPLLLIYAVILWLYIAKIVVMMELPKGGVAYMVSAFAVAGVSLHFSASTHAAEAHPLMLLWRRWFPAILSAPLVLLVTAIWTRIQDYGVTEERYAVALLALWLLAALFVMLLLRDKRRLIWLYASAVLLLFFASFGPWSAASVSEASQIGRLGTLLREYDLLSTEGYITPQKESDIPKHAVREISSIVSYLNNSGKIPALRPWFALQPDAAVHHNQKRYFNVAAIMNDMGLEYTYKNGSEDSRNTPFNHGFEVFSSGRVLDVGDYNRITQIHFYVGNYLAKKLEDGVEAAFDPEKQQVTVTVQGEEPLVFPLDAIIPLLKENKPQPEIIATTSISATSDTMRGRIYTTSLGGHFDKDNGVHIQNLTILLLYQRY